MKWTPGKLKFALNLYPPYFFTGVRVAAISPDWKKMEVSMRLRWFNKNAVGTHFGGSLYSMVDPHHMLLMMQLLGRDYFVWDQTAKIVFRKPGRGHVRTTVQISDEILQEILQQTSDGEPFRPEFELSILDDDNEIVATVSKVLYVRKKA
ncbi:MAG: DUF4442 domain-containing protein [Woeseiaceae bacterium]